MKFDGRLVLMGALAAITVGGMPRVAMAQADGGQTGDVSNQLIASLDLEDVDVRDAIRALFKNVNANYVVAPEVQGTVTVELKNVKFEVALRNVLDQVKATYRIEGGIYNIIKREEPAEVTTDQNKPNLPQTAKTPVRIYIDHADPLFIITLLAARSTTAAQMPEISTLQGSMMFGGGMGGMGMGGGMMGGMGGGMMGGMGGGMMGGMGGMMGGMGGMMGGMGGYGGGMGGYGGGMGGYGGGYGGMGGGYGGGGFGRG